MSIIPTTTDREKWTPPQTQTVNFIIKGMIITALGYGVLTIFNHLAPGMVQGVLNLDQLFQSGTKLLWTLAVFAVTLIFLNSLFSSSGTLNRLYNIFFASFANKITWAAFNLDPLTPLYEGRKAAAEKGKKYDDAFAEYDGTCSHIATIRDKFLTDSKAAERLGKEAKARMDRGDMSFEEAFKTNTYQAGRYAETAQKFDGMLRRLDIVRGDIKKVQSAVRLMISNIDTDIRAKKAEWEIAQSVETMNKTARSLFQGDQKQELAQIAADLIETKYAGELGRLENLMDTQQALLSSVDLTQGSYSQEYLDKWQADAQPLLIEGSKAPASPATSDQAQSFKNLIN